MASNVEKYRIDCDAPGMQIAGSGIYFGGGSIVPPNTILTLAAGTVKPRACMTPLNKAAEAAFARERDAVEKAWRESLPKGETPEGQPIESLEGKKLSKEELEVWVARVVAKVGPAKRKLERDGKKDRPNIAPGVMRADVAQPAKKPDPIDEMLLDDDEEQESAAAKEPAAPAKQRRAADS